MEITLGRSYSLPDGEVVTLNYLDTSIKAKRYKESATATRSWFASGSPGDMKVDPSRTLVAELHPAIVARLRPVEAGPVAVPMTPKARLAKALADANEALGLLP